MNFNKLQSIGMANSRFELKWYSKIAQSNRARIMALPADNEKTKMPTAFMNALDFEVLNWHYLELEIF